jgi:predicted aspartyl protease
MSKPFSSIATSIVLSSILAGLGTACQTNLLSSRLESRPDSTPTQSDDSSEGVGIKSKQTSPDAPTSVSASTEDLGSSQSMAQAPAPDAYPEAINRASSAFKLGQLAQSQDDWRLVVGRWQQAIDLMATVPTSSPNHGAAQDKLVEYRRNLVVAQQQAAQAPAADSGPGRVVVVSPHGSDLSSPTSDPNSATPFVQTPLGETRQTDDANVARGGVYQAPIIRRAGGTPVIMVTFDGNQSFEMIVDTGASGTVITQRMASMLGVTPIGQTQVATASASRATFLLGRVNSIEVGGTAAQDLVVAIAGPELSTGLLGHDFFGNFDVTVRQDVVEFRERS